METIKFKTSIKCEGCVAKVAPHLNNTAGNDNWKVDVQNPDKVLTITNKNSVSEADVIKAVQKAGFKAELID